MAAVATDHSADSCALVGRPCASSCTFFMVLCPPFYSGGISKRSQVKGRDAEEAVLSSAGAHFYSDQPTQGPSQVLYNRRPIAGPQQCRHCIPTQHGFIQHTTAKCSIVHDTLSTNTALVRHAHLPSSIHYPPSLHRTRLCTYGAKSTNNNCSQPHAAQFERDHTVQNQYKPVNYTLQARICAQMSVHGRFLFWEKIHF